MKSPSPTGIEAISTSDIACSQRRGLSATVQTGSVCAALATAAIAVGVWTGLKVSPQPADGTTSVLRCAGALPSRGVKDIVVGARLPGDYVPIGLVEIDGSSFAILSKQAGPLSTKDMVSGGGFADVFDKQGRLLRH